MRGLITAGVALAGILLGVIFVHENTRIETEVYTFKQETVHDPDAAISRLSKALSVPTLASQTAPNHISDPAPFQRLHAHLETSFPALFDKLDVDRVNSYSLLMSWQGMDASLRPIVLMSHLDVVPAPPANWTHPPFSGTVSSGWVYGRGALDTKSTMMAILEAVNQLLTEGFIPRRTIILAFGHDEEVGGEYGARGIADTLAERGIQAELVLDEGGLILTEGLLAGGMKVVDGQVAVVGTAEKGLQDWVIKVTGTGGHSSIPPTGDGSSVAARLSRLLNRLETEQTSTRLGPPTTDFLKGLAPAVRWAPLRAILRAADNSIVNPVLGQLLGQVGGPSLAAAVRSTCAVVGVAAGGVAHNVLPREGEITLNLRTLPGDDTASIREYLTTVIQKEADARIERLPAPAYDASPVTPAKGPAWDLVVRAIKEALGPHSHDESTGKAGVANSERQLKFTVVPYLVSGMTDSRWYTGIAPGRVFRFSPIRMTLSDGDLGRIHGVDERIAVENYIDAVRFYLRFMRLAAGEEPAPTT